MVINGIDTRDISVVVQGAVDKYITPLCLASIREHLPGAEIILSTWEGTNVEGMDYDQVVLNKDPGSFDFSNVEYSVKSNFHRQVRSTVEGLRVASRKYAVKLRTDFVLKSAGFLKWFDRYPVDNKQYTFFKHKVICCSLYSRNPRFSYGPLRFVLHPADFFAFGLKEDLLDMFDVPFITSEERLYMTNKYPDRYVYDMYRFTSEQYFWIGFLKKHLTNIEVLPQDREDFSASAISLTEMTFAANLIILSNEQIGLECMKSGVYKMISEPGNCFTHFDWYCLYMRYCKKGIALYSLYRIKTFLKNQRYRIKWAPGRLLGRLKSFLQNRVKPNLTPKEKEQLKPIYFRLKKLYLRLKTHTHQENWQKSFFCEPVTDRDISVVVQGAVSAATRECLESVRRMLPGAELILSTWENTEVDGLTYDKVIFSPDPGPNGLIRRYPHPHIHNVNRQIVSSRAGVLAATRRYCMKLRSDMLITSTGFLDYYNKYSQYIATDSLVSRRIMVEGYLSPVNNPFSLSDWWYLGLTGDIRNLFSIPLYEVEKIPYFEQPENSKQKPNGVDAVCRYNPEQYIMYQYLMMCAPAYMKEGLVFRHCFDRQGNIVEKYHEFVAGNILCLEYTKSGVILPKAKYLSTCVRPINNFSFEKWYELCKSYRTLPSITIDSSIHAEAKQQKNAYLEAPQFYNVSDYAAIIESYAKLASQSEYSNISSIQKSDITFVVSGKVTLEGELNTRRCLGSIRRFFPESRIVLSTWNNQNVDSLRNLCDQIVLREQPKIEPIHYHLPDFPDKRVNSVNLQQIIVHAGMDEVTTKYAVRMRTDQVLYNDHFLQFYNAWSKILNKTDVNYQVFENRVLVLRQFTPDTRAICRPYGLSDCFQFGKVEDLRKLWDGHQEDRETLNYFADHPNSKWENPERFNHRYIAEQCFFLNYLKKCNLNIRFPKFYCDHSSENLVFEQEKMYAANILVGSNRQLGIGFRFRDDQYTAGLNFERFLELYLYNIEPNNQKCLEYLKRRYTLPKKKKDTIISTCTIVCFKSVRLFLYSIKTAIKCLMRMILPAYRVGVGTRERLMAFEEAETGRFDATMRRIEDLEREQRKNQEEIRRLRSRLFPQDDDEDQESDGDEELEE